VFALWVSIPLSRRIKPNRDINPTLYPQNLNGTWGGAAVGGKGIQFGGNALGKAAPYNDDGKINPKTGKRESGNIY